MHRRMSNEVVKAAESPKAVGMAVEEGKEMVPLWGVSFSFHASFHLPPCCWR